MEIDGNFIEYESYEGANQVNLDEYSFIGIKRGSYCFKIKEKVRKLRAKEADKSG